MGASDSLRTSSRKNAGLKSHQCLTCNICTTHEKHQEQKNSSLISNLKRKVDEEFCERSKKRKKTCTLETHNDRCVDKSKTKLNLRPRKEKCSTNKMNVSGIYGDVSFESSNSTNGGVNQPVDSVPSGDLLVKNSIQVRTEKEKPPKVDKFCKKLGKLITNDTLVRKGADKSKTKVKVLKPKVNSNQNSHRYVKDRGCKKNGNETLNKSTFLMNDGVFLSQPSILLKDLKEFTNCISDLPKRRSAEPSVTKDITLNDIKMSFVDVHFWQSLTSTANTGFANKLIANYNIIKHTILESVEKISESIDASEMESSYETDVTLNSIDEGVNIFSVELGSNENKVAKSNKEPDEISSAVISVELSSAFDGIYEEINLFSDSCNAFDTNNSASDKLNQSIPLLQNEQLSDFSAVLGCSDMPELSIMDEKSFALENTISQTFVDLHKNSCLGLTKDEFNHNDDSIKSENQSVTQENGGSVDYKINLYDLIDNISKGDHVSDFSSQHVKDQNSSTENPQSGFSTFTCPQCKKQIAGTEQDKHHCEASIIESDNSSVNDNVLSKLLSPNIQNNQSMKSDVDLENSQRKLTHPATADFSSKSGISNSEMSLFIEKMAELGSLCSPNEGAGFSFPLSYKSMSDIRIRLPNLKIEKEDVESGPKQIPSTPETCIKCKKPLHFEMPAVEETSLSNYSNNPLQLDLPCSVCKHIYPVVFRKDILDILTSFLDKLKKSQKNTLQEKQNSVENKIKEESIDLAPCIEQVFTISHDDFYKITHSLNRTENSLQEHFDPVQQKIVQNAHLTGNSSVVPIQSQVTLFSDFHSSPDLYMNSDKRTYFCGECHLTLMTEQIAKHFKTEHKTLKNKFNVFCLE